MTRETVHYELRQGVGILRLDRPEVHNVVDAAVLERLERCVERLDGDRVRAVVLTGAGSRTFCAGADLSWVGALESHEEGLGLSRRMRFDLVVNQMTRNAVESGKITVMGGGDQWRPLVHVRDVARAMLNIAGQDPKVVNGEVFNVGRDNYQIRSLAFTVRENLPFPVTVETLGDSADKRNYNVSFDKARDMLGFEAQYDVAYAVREIYDAIKQGSVDLGERTVTVDWYRHLLDAQQLVAQVELNGRIL